LQARPPLLYFSDSCEHTIRCVASVQHDENKPEDLDTEGEDHIVDETRYACASRPVATREPIGPIAIKYARTVSELTFTELVALNRKARMKETQYD